jgi:uncharacterized protein YhfF
MLRIRLLALIGSLLLSSVSAASPAVEAFWKACSEKIAEPPVDGFYRVRNFGDNEAMATLLLDLITAGEKTVTFPIPWLYEGTRELTPTVGGYVVVTDFTGTPGALLRTTSITTRAFNEITEDYTRFEGPGARTLEAWRDIHWKFYTRVLKPRGRSPTHNMPVTAERFELVCTASDI